MKYLRHSVLWAAPVTPASTVRDGSCSPMRPRESTSRITPERQYQRHHARTLVDIEPGDLLFYGYDGDAHVAMYVGDGKMIEAEMTGTLVHVVQFASATDSWSRVARGA